MAGAVLAFPATREKSEGDREVVSEKGINHMQKQRNSSKRNGWWQGYGSETFKSNITEVEALVVKNFF